MLFGQHDATGYGVGWSGDDRRSDVKDVCGDYPALFSWDAYHIFMTTRQIWSALSFALSTPMGWAA